MRRIRKRTNKPGPMFGSKLGAQSFRHPTNPRRIFEPTSGPERHPGASCQGRLLQRIPRTACHGFVDLQLVARPTSALHGLKFDPVGGGVAVQSSANQKKCDRSNNKSASPATSHFSPTWPRTRLMYPARLTASQQRCGPALPVVP